MLNQKEITKIKGTLNLESESERWPIIFDALSDPTRFRIFRLLTAGRDVCVTDVARILEVSISAASQQLKILERAGLARKTKMGQMTCYEIKSEDRLVSSLIKLLI